MLELGDGSLRATLATSEEDTIQFPFCVENHANTIRKSVHNWYPRAKFCKLETVKIPRLLADSVDISSFDLHSYEVVLITNICQTMLPGSIEHLADFEELNNYL